MNQKESIAASVFERLENVAKRNNRSLDSTLLVYFQERFLYRLSKSHHRERFLLKGELFLFALTKFSARPSRDIDFLATYFSSEIKNIEQAFKEVCSTETEDDGVIFRVDRMTTERIKEDANDESVSIKIPVALGQAENELQLKIGFRDVVIPKPQTMDFPVLLDMEQPIIMTYSIESIVSEKFEDIISHSDLNDRIKDFYDLYMLSSSQVFEGRVLQEAILETFERRKTLMEKEHPLFTKDFCLDPARNAQWTAFIKEIGIAEDLSFEVVMKQLQEFIEPIYQAVLHEDEFFGRWDFNELRWIKIFDV
ncbi:hypothetical protein AU377_04555 [Sporosarcina sp. HYO08]|nr:hypothetical protein AU377_04555 [Sporosarcina sp. HYO08]